MDKVIDFSKTVYELCSKVHDDTQRSSYEKNKHGCG